MWTFFDFQYGFRPTQSTADLPTVAFDRNVGNFNRSGTNWAEALDIFKVCNRIWDTHKCKSYRISGEVFFHISCFTVIDNFKWF